MDLVDYTLFLRWELGLQAMLLASVYYLEFACEINGWWKLCIFLVFQHRAGFSV